MANGLPACRSSVLLLLWMLVSASLRAQDSTVDFSALHRQLTQTADAVLAESRTGSSPEAAPQDLQSDAVDFPSALPQNSSRWAAMVLPIFAQHGLPASLIAVMQAESGGNPYALSSKGARGLWQLMPATARRYGLQVNAHIDERLDPVRSTEAAAHYLQDLYAQFGNWPLALAAYNWGEQHVVNALTRTRAITFEALNTANLLPAETRAYVPTVMAHWNAPLKISKPLPVAVVYAQAAPFTQSASWTEALSAHPSHPTQFE